MVSMLSCLALSTKPQVLMITIWWSSPIPSCSTSNLLAFSCPISTSLSTRFLLQPSVTTFTLFFLSVFVFIQGAKIPFFYGKLNRVHVDGNLVAPVFVAVLQFVEGVINGLPQGGWRLIPWCFHQDALIILVFDPRNKRKFGSQQVFAKSRLQQGKKLSGQVAHLVHVPGDHVQLEQARKGRVKILRGLAGRIFKKCLEIILHHIAQHRVLRLRGLHKYPAFFLFAPGPAAHLGNELEGFFEGAEI